MTPLTITLGAILLALAVFLIVIILKQTGKDKSLSGAIAGSAETFFGKSKGNSSDRILSVLTIIGSLLFVVITVALTIVVSKGI